MSLLVQASVLCSRGGPQGVPNLPLPRTHHSGVGLALWAAAMVRVRVCPQPGRRASPHLRSDLTSVRLAGHPPHPSAGPTLVSANLSWADSCSPAKRTWTGPRRGRGPPGFPWLRPLFGFCFGLHVFYPEIRSSALGRRGVSPLPPFMGLTVTGHLTRSIIAFNRGWHDS